MNKILPLLLLLFSSGHPCFTQNPHKIDSLETLLQTARDTNKVKTLLALGDILRNGSSGKATEYYQQAFRLSEKINFKKGIAFSLIGQGFIFETVTLEFEKAMEYFDKALKIGEELNNLEIQCSAYMNIAGIYSRLEQSEKEFAYYNNALNIAKKIKDTIRIINCLYDQVKSLKAMGSKKNYNTILLVIDQGIKLCELSHHEEMKGLLYCALGELLLENGKLVDAEIYIKKSLTQNEKSLNYRFISYNYEQLASLYEEKKDYQKAIMYANKGLSIANEHHLQKEIIDCLNTLGDIYSTMKDYKNALWYNNKYHALNDSVYSAQSFAKISQIQNQYAFDKKQAADSLKFAKEKEIGALLLQRQKAITWTGFSGVALTLLFLFFMYRGFRKQKRSNQIIENTNAELHKVNTELKDTQAQLVQQEKLASLGALTAGIAHEIKNPLNFVNNFAELSHELLGEMNVEIDKGNYEDAKAISKDIQINLSKINEHGKRADGIVKSMLEHSRSGTGEKQPTDINKLCDEYLNLAYHGMRASVKDFNCTLERHFAEHLPKVNVVPQDISRVLLNLINNAFYAIKDKPHATLLMTTLTTASSVIIKIKDNGTGIPEDVKQKIFEPFFTTKPAGSGTGLGLSLSFDIIKAHGGKIEVQSEEGKGTEFIITLPV